MGWAEEEFETLDLGDTRLNRRAVLLAERLSQKPGASIPGACGSWSETVAAYRFLDNEEVSWDDVRFRHRLEKHKLADQILVTINDLLEQRGLLLRAGTAVDATLIAAPSSTKNKGMSPNFADASMCRITS